MVSESLLQVFFFFSSLDNDQKEMQIIQFIEKSRAEKFCK